MHKNTLKTYLLLAALGGFLVFLGRTFLGPSGATIGLVIAFVMVGSSYWFSDKLAIRASRAQPVTEQEVSFAKLFSTHPPMEERIARLRAPLAHR